MKKSAEKATEKATEKVVAKAKDKVVERQLVPDKQATASAKAAGVSVRELVLRYAVEMLQAHREGRLDDDAVLSRCTGIRTVLDCADAIEFERHAALDEREADVGERETTLEKQGESYVGNVGSWRLYVR